MPSHVFWLRFKLDYPQHFKYPLYWDYAAQTLSIGVTTGCSPLDSRPASLKWGKWVRSQRFSKWGNDNNIINKWVIHGPACIAFRCSHLYITNPGSVSHFAKTWVSLLTTTYIRKSTKYIDILLLLTCEEVLHAPTVQIWAQNSTISTPNNLLIVCHSSITNWSQNIFSEFEVNVLG